jgi:hypothetical protein
MIPPPMRLPDYPPIRHECYNNSLIFILANPEWTLVHGTPIGGRDFAERIGHAWAEIEHRGFMWVFDPTSCTLLPAAFYYAGGQINYTVRYTSEQAAILALMDQSSGPWDERVINAAHVDSTPAAPKKKRARKRKRLDKQSS